MRVTKKLSLAETHPELAVQATTGIQRHLLRVRAKSWLGNAIMDTNGIQSSQIEPKEIIVQFALVVSQVSE